MELAQARSNKALLQLTHARPNEDCYTVWTYWKTVGKQSDHTLACPPGCPTQRLPRNWTVVLRMVELGVTANAPVLGNTEDIARWEARLTALVVVIPSLEREKWTGEGGREGRRN